ncbi:serine/threonine-protein kinase [Microbacterium sp. bgisy203]|uniref:serine/threonine-protein kinase n=1 Tax=Microbacterium sp. bgisy203 TaxID=3413799 RepID=UPI003D72DA0A
MSSKRPPAPPPALAGFSFVEVLGSGGFADVYLYEQQLPRRRVAVKVMLDGRMSDGAADRFAAEANAMAMLSTHPAIVTIYQAGVADDGRPYLVMEYCPRPNLQIRSRAQAFSVAEALRVGVQVAAAVETAHRAGILHRDIKPANILVTEYNRPALTDFGIATSGGVDEASGGMSIPWSPPEAFSDDGASGVGTDVYALGATVYTLLAGHSPFEQPGGRNGGADLIERIETQPVPPLRRADVPPSLQLALERAMAKRPGDRYESAVAFARALQRVQIEAAHSVTPIDILDDAPAGAEPEDADGELTRVRGIVSIDPQTAPAAGPTRPRDVPPVVVPPTFAPPSSSPVGSPATTPEADDRTVARPPVSIAPSAPNTPGPAAQPLTAPGAAAPPYPPALGPGEEPAPRRSRRGLWIGIAATVAILAVAAAVATAVSGVFGGPDAEKTPAPTTSVAPQDPLDDIVPAVSDLAGTVQGGEVVFTWTNPDPREGDGYLWYTYTLAEQADTARVMTESVTVPVDPSGTTCIAVTLMRDDARIGPETKVCTP